MIREEELFDRALAKAVESYVSRGIHDTESVLPRVRANIEAASAGRRRRPRRLWLLPAVAIIAGLVGGGAYAVQTLGAPVVIKFLGWPTRSDSSTSAPNCTADQALDRATTLPEAQRAVKYHIITLAPATTQGSIELTDVEFSSGCDVVKGREGVVLTYLVDGVRIRLNESPADNPRGPLVVGMKGYKLPPNVSIKVIDDRQYAVWMMPVPNKFNLPAGVTTAAWQTGGTVVYFDILHTDERGLLIPLPWATFQDIVECLR
jgi:hypothetical protein